MKQKVPKVGPSQETEPNWKDWGENHFLERQGKCCFLGEQWRLGDSSCPGQLQGMLGVELGRRSDGGFHQVTGKRAPQVTGLMSRGQVMSRCFSGSGPRGAFVSEAHGRPLTSLWGWPDFSLWWAMAGCPRLIDGWIDCILRGRVCMAQECRVLFV